MVLCVDEKSQIQDLDRTAPMLPMQPGGIERRTHDPTPPLACAPPRRVRSRLGLRHQPRSPGTVITGHHWSQINRPPQNPSLDVLVCFNWGGFEQESTGTPTGIRTQDHVLIRHARGISSLL